MSENTEKKGFQEEGSSQRGGIDWEEEGGAEEEGEEEETEEEHEEEEKEDDFAREEDDEDFQLRFEGEMDPFALAEDDNSGAQPYQQFERLEYEALAARKRKALAQQREKGAKKAKQQELFGASIDEIWEASGLGFGRQRKRKETKKRGRPKRPPGIRGPMLTPDVTKKLGDANLLYASGHFEEAVDLLKEVVRLAPNVPDSYHILGLVYNSLCDRKKAMNFYMIAAHLTPKDAMLWKRLALWSMEQGSTGQATYCLKKAMKADPEDVNAKWDLALLYSDLKDFVKAAEIFEQILALRPNDVEVCKMVAKMQHESGQYERATQVLMKLIDEQPTEANLTVVNLLAAFHVEKKEFSAALSCIEQARRMYCSGGGLPLDLAIKAGLCHAHLGHISDAEGYFQALEREQAEEFLDLLLEVGNAYLDLNEHRLALKYYNMLEGNSVMDNVAVRIKMGRCYAGLKEYTTAIQIYHQVVRENPQDVDARLELVSLLLESTRPEEALQLLLCPESAECSQDEEPWWQNPKVKVKLAQIYHMQEKFDSFLDAILPSIQETLFIEIINQKVKSKKRLPKSVLSARVKMLDDSQVDSVIRGFMPVLSDSDKLKAQRARRALAVLEAKKEERKAAVLAAGLEWQTDEDLEEAVEGEIRVPPLPRLFDDEEYYQLLLQACKALSLSKRYWEALEILDHTLKVGHSYITEKRNELRSLRTQIIYESKDARYGYDSVRYMVQQRPYSITVWNSYYQFVSRSERRVPKHSKFMLAMRDKYPDCVPPMLICGHQFAMISQPQGALREYLHAYKVQPEDPFTNLCIGVSFINLSLAFRLTNRNQCILQGFCFLYNYQRLANYNQESNYNIARAYHHVGLVNLAVLYYEKVLAHREKDYPVVTLPQDSSILSHDVPQRTTALNNEQKCTCCDLQREAAHNLHLIYRKSGAVDLARQVLQDYCSS